MYSFLYCLTAPTKDADKIKSAFPVIFSQAKETNNIFSEFLLQFDSSQDQHILEDKIQNIPIEVFLLEELY